MKTKYSQSAKALSNSRMSSGRSIVSADQTIDRLMSAYAWISRFLIPITNCHGISGSAILDSSEIRLAASASRIVRSRRKSSILRPPANDMASLAASSMCRSRMTSGSFILKGGRRNHLIPEIAAEFFWGPQIDFPPQPFGQFQFHSGDAEQCRAVVRFKLHQNVDVALRPESRRQDGTKKRKLANMIPPAEFFDLGLRQCESSCGHAPSVFHIRPQMASDQLK